jgi:hypothetical protein
VLLAQSCVRMQQQRAQKQAQPRHDRHGPAVPGTSPRRGRDMTGMSGS